jgi:hypothetical protein
VLLEWEGSVHAEGLRKEAISGKNFGDRKSSGHPLSVVLDSKGKIVWAGAELSLQELEEMKTLLG